MSVVQLTNTYLQALKRSLREQCNAGSVHLTEAIARGCGARTHAALLARIKAGGEGIFIRFNEAAFSHRLVELSGNSAPDALDFPDLHHSARYIPALFDDPALDILDLHVMRVRFCLKGIATVIEIHLEDMGNGYTRFIRSHAIHAPGQAGPYWPSRDFDDDAAYAMHRAIDSIVDYYRDAIRNGHKPSASWLIESKYR
ncbi:hypothetical protein J2045_001953 [Peteryoungia aggregata LMG 23059]|uniref:Uncharacterized protein n=1 Tax=Peteryoungia aggregata LMG 23059 TaxID=1368425 RepID=A0ABU0G6H2_9HYPH|nr:hypothetical protein [Peteryoungia aggregata]MDQ0420926.1 hypothetical protein [Peteryoungia aggregata LMG 23059]